MATLSEETTYYDNGMALKKMLKQIGVEFELLTGEHLGSFVNCKMLWKGEVDFAIASNDTRLTEFFEEEEEASIADSKIRTVLPLYPEILFVVYDGSLYPKSFEDLVVGKRIGVGPENSGTSKMFKFVLEKFGIDSSRYVFVHTPWLENVVSDSIDISVTLAGFNTVTVTGMMATGWPKIFSFGTVEQLGKGSPIEGFNINYPSAKPYVIPMNTYGSSPKEPVVTLAIDSVLLCRKDINEYTIFNIVEEIYKQKNILAEIDPLLSGLNENFDRNSMSFPLHPGTLMYLNRNRPSFFERYAEMIGVVFSIAIALFGGLVSLFRWRKSVKKTRIDEQYEEVLDVEKNLDNFNTLESCTAAIENLTAIKKHAFELLIKEKLAANESFDIFLTLVDNLVERIERRMSKLEETAVVKN